MSEPGTDSTLLSLPSAGAHRSDPVLGVQAGAVQPASASRQRLVRLELRVADRARRLGVPGLAGIVALVTCAAFVQSSLLPQQARVRDLRAAAESTANVPARSPAAARPAADGFIASLPDRDALPGMLAAIVQQAQAAGLSLDRGAYQWSSEKSGAVARYQLVLPVSGTYPAVRHFVDSTLAAVPAAALAGMTLERPNVGDGIVNANLQFEIFVRNTP